MYILYGLLTSFISVTLRTVCGNGPALFVVAPL